MPYHIDEENSELVFEVHDGNKLTIKIKSNIFSDSLELYLIKVGDATVPTDNNVFSANRVLYEIENAVKNIEPGNSFWELKEDENGNKYISTKYDAVSEKGLTAYASSVAQVPSIFDGLPLDNVTIQKNPETGLIEVIGGTGGGASDWSQIKNKPLWIGENKPTYSWGEISGERPFYTKEELDGKFVTVDETEQDILGLKNFLSGLSIGNSKKKIYEKDGVVYIDADVAVTGGVTAYALGGREVSTIMDGVVVDGTTIVKENGVLKALAGSNFDEEAMWTVLASSDSDRQINLSHLSNALSGYATQSWVQSQGYATQSSLDSVSEKLNDFLEGSDTDTIINKWKELEAFLSGMTESDNLAKILSMKADESELEKYVTLATEQEITGLKHFTQGLSVGASKHRIYEQDGVVYLDGDLAVTGGVTAYAQGDRTPSTILDGLIIDATTLSKEGGKLSVIGGVGGASNWDELEGKPSWIGASKPTYNWSEILAKPTTLDGFGITDTYTKTESDERFVNVSGDTMNGQLTISNGYALFVKSNESGVRIIPSGNIGYLQFGNEAVSNYNGIISGINGTNLSSLNILSSSDVTINSNKIWHAGNDGSGSGLDADMLDGLHNGYLQANTIGYNSKSHQNNCVQFMQFESQNEAGDLPSDRWHTVMKMNHGDGDSYYNRALAFDFFSERIYTRRRTSGTAYSWLTLAFTSDNVASATKLQTGRYLWGQYFDGQDNVNGTITITNGNNLYFSNGGEVQIANTPGGSWYIGYGAGGQQSFNIYCNSGYYYYLRLLNGNVGIGNISPSYKLHIDGSCRASLFSSGEHSDDVYGIYNCIRGSGQGNFSCYAMVRNGIIPFAMGYGSNNTILFGQPNNSKGFSYIWASIGGTTSTFYGNILSTGGVTCYSSDSRAKTILEELNLSLKEIAESPIVRFKWNNWKIKDDGKTHIGGIAQYIQKILPETILEADGMLNLDYSTTAYIYSVQTARHLLKTESEVDKLKKEVKRLKKEIKDLKMRYM